VYEGVNTFQNEKSGVPSSAEEGWMRDEKRNCEATKIRADGVVLVKFHHIFLTNTTPALRATPPLLRRGHIARLPIHSRGL